jgi:hypothetical protein
VLEDDSVQIKSWSTEDDRLLGRIRYARQNGVPLVEFDERTQSTVPGELVSQWGPGNWSGSEDMSLRTLRAGVAVSWQGQERFLIYAVFPMRLPRRWPGCFRPTAVVTPCTWT